MPNDTRSGLRSSGNRSYGGMNVPQSLDLTIIEAVWDHQQKPEELFLIPESLSKRVQALLKNR